MKSSIYDMYDNIFRVEVQVHFYLFSQVVKNIKKGEVGKPRQRNTAMGLSTQRFSPLTEDSRHLYENVFLRFAAFEHFEPVVCCV